MRHTHNRVRTYLCGALLSAASTASTAAGTSLPAVWRSHHALIDYYGVGALYTCDGIESKVRDILTFLGARKDMRLAVSNCVGIGRPSRTATVTVDFATLAISGLSETHAAAQWSHFTIGPGHPFFMGQGECELVRRMETLIRASFSVRGLHYETSCAPREIALDSYLVNGEVLRAADRATERAAE